MTSDHLDDDALSAHLDGEATPEEAAHVESCAPCGERVEVLRRAASLIGGPVEVDDARRESAIAAALAVDAPVSLDARRRRQPPAWLLGAAAALIVLAGLVPLLGRAGNSDDSVATAQLEQGESAADEDSAGGADATAMAPEALSTPADAGLGELAGQVPERLRTELQAAATRTTSDQQDATMAYTVDCSGAARRDGLGELRLQAPATFEGRPVQVVVFDVAGTDPPQVRALLVDPTDCTTVVHEETFAP